MIDAAVDHADDMSVPLGELLRKKAASNLTEEELKGSHEKLFREMDALDGFAGENNGKFIVGDRVRYN